MLRYRCRNCTQILQAHELRAGKTSVCTKCLSPHTIPADRSEWLNDADDQLTSLYPPAPEEEPEFASSWSVAVEPPPTPAALPSPPPPNEPPAPVDAVRAQTPADVAATLAEAIALRTEPRRKPRDLRPSTAAWLFLTGLGQAFLLAGLFTAGAAIGIVQIAIGYAWIVAPVARRDLRQGLACAVPPITFYYLVQWKYEQLRPLRFVATGAALLGATLI